jgi:hypothetical protein
LTRVIEQAAGVHNRTDVAERFEFENFAGAFHGHGLLVEVNGHFIAGFQNVNEAFSHFARIQFAGGYGVAEENARETFGEDDSASGRAECDGRVFTRAAATEVFPGHDNRIIRVELAFRHEAGRVKRFRQTVERVTAELLVFLGNRRHQVQILRGDDLVGIDVIAHYVNSAGKNRFRHALNLPVVWLIFNPGFDLCGLYATANTWHGRDRIVTGMVPAVIGMIPAVIGMIPAVIGTVPARLGTVETRLGTIETRLGTIETRLGTIETRLGTIETRLGTVETRLGTVETRLGTVETRLGTVETRLGTIETRLGMIPARLGRFQIHLDSP